MLTNYFMTALRLLRKHRVYSLINVAGLAAGLACCVIIFLYVQDEFRYDRFHQHYERIYRVISHEKDDGRLAKLASSYMPLAPLLQSQLSGIDDIVRILPRSMLVAYAETKFQEDRVFFCDSTFLTIFSFPLQRGDADVALATPNSVVLTAAMAEKYFGDADPIGRRLRFDDRLDFIVTGVLAPLPRQSHLQFDFLADMRSLGTLMGEWVFSSQKSWHWPPVYTYALLESADAAGAVAAQIPALLQENLGAQQAAGREHLLQPLSKIFLYSELEGEIAPMGSIRYVTLFSLIAFFVLAIAWVNFMNLSTARAADRAREVGLRRVVGARRHELLLQFLSETMCYAVLAAVVALGLVEALLPIFNAAFDKQLQLDFFGNQWLWGYFVLLTLTTGLLAGSYPALVLTRFRAAHMLRSSGASRDGGHGPQRLRAALVIGQFAISLILIVLTAGVQQQLQFVHSDRLGFARDQSLVVPIRDERIQMKFELIKNGLQSVGGVTATTVLSNFPWESGYYGFPVWAEGMPADQTVNLATLFADHDFVEAFGVDLVAGRSFSRQFGADAAEAVLINETAAHKLGYTQPLGKKLTIHSVTAEPVRGRIVGVIRDFHLRSLHYEVEPLVVMIAPEHYFLDNLLLRLPSEQAAALLPALQQRWQELVPERPFEYFFLDETFDRLYRSEQQLGRLFSYFAALTVFVACLGLFGLATYTALQRRREIGIRKVLGASVAGIVVLLCRRTVILVSLACLGAIPLAHLLLQRWLQGFAYRSEPAVELYGGACAGLLLIALLTVSFQAIRAALLNPVETLKQQ